MAISPSHLAGRTLTGLFSLAVLILIIVGCATEVGQHTMLKQGYAPKPANYPIAVFTNSLPTQPYERVSLLDVHCESQGFLVPNLEHDGLPVLMKQARAAGCDAIIEIQERHADNWTLETKVKHYTAVGIAYK